MMSYEVRRLLLECLETRRVWDADPWLGAEGEGPSPMPDFSLVDVNPASPTNTSSVSPRQYLDKISAWYFGHST